MSVHKTAVSLCFDQGRFAMFWPRTFSCVLVSLCFDQGRFAMFWPRTFPFFRIKYVSEMLPKLLDQNIKLFQKSSEKKIIINLVEKLSFVWGYFPDHLSNKLDLEWSGKLFQNLFWNLEISEAKTFIYFNIWWLLKLFWKILQSNILRENWKH